jgi:hypothetical protein
VLIQSSKHRLGDFAFAGRPAVEIDANGVEIYQHCGYIWPVVLFIKRFKPQLKEC